MSQYESYLMLGKKKRYKRNIGRVFLIHPKHSSKSELPSMTRINTEDSGKQ